MNVSTGEPKNGDFVAYLAEIERRQLQGVAGAGKTVDAPPAPAAHSGAPAAPKAVSAGPAAPRQARVLALAAIGIALLIAGLLVDGGIIFVLVGVFMLWQALRTLVRGLRADDSGRRQAAERIAALLAGRTQRRGPPDA
jgi:hypothetical protein